MARKFTAGVLADAAYLAKFEVGTEWHDGAFTARRTAELVRLGALVPTDQPGVFRVGRPAETADGDVDSPPHGCKECGAKPGERCRESNCQGTWH